MLVYANFDATDILAQFFCMHAIHKNGVLAVGILLPEKKCFMQKPDENTPIDGTYRYRTFYKSIR